MIVLRSFRCFSLIFILAAALLAPGARASSLDLPPEGPAVLEKIYSFDLAGAIAAAKHMQQEHPEEPLGYLFETEALWWRIWCTSAEVKYGLSDTRRRPKQDSDQYYLELSNKVLFLAESRLKQNESAEMHFYAGMAEAMLSRLYALRGEYRNTARFAVRGREHLLRAKALDPSLADADFGLGLYSYYVDTLSSIARVLRFFMGIPGGTKRDGIRMLEHAISQGELTSNVARFYLAMDLHRYDLQYERALAILTPLVEKYPSNPIFQLACGDLYAKLGRKPQALACYRAAEDSSERDLDCHGHLLDLARTSIAALNAQ